MKTLAETVKEEARRLGADLVGIAPVSRWEHAPQRMTPNAHLPNAETVVVMGIHHADASVEWCGIPTANFIGPCQRGMIPKLDTMSLRMSRFLEDLGHEALPMPCTGYWRHRPYKDIPTDNTASFSHRHAAVAAGMGEFGWNNMFMSEKYGPRQRLISVITNACITPDPLYDGPRLCDRCNMCVRECTGRCFDRDVLPPGKDVVRIEDRTYEYAKINRWNCIWSEQFGLDVRRKPEHVNEDSIFEALDKGIPRTGGSFGSCLRFCMGANNRIWDREDSDAPRRKKEKRRVSWEDRLRYLKTTAMDGGADRIVVAPLSMLDNQEVRPHESYPWDRVKSLFPWVIAVGRRLPSRPEPDVGASSINDQFVRSALETRLQIASQDMARKIDEWGDDAMVLWHWSLPLAKAAVLGDACADDMVWHGLLTSVECEEADAVLPEPGSNVEAFSVSKAARETLALQSSLPVEGKRLFSDAPGMNRTLKHVDMVGIASAETVRQLPNVLPVDSVLEGVSSVIVLLAHIPETSVTRAGEPPADCAMSYSFVQYQLMRELTWAGADLCRQLEQEGHAATLIPDLAAKSYPTLGPYGECAWTGIPDLRANAPAAAAAGLGKIGRSGLLLTERFGPRQRFVFVLTSADLPASETCANGICRECGACARACPVSALNPDALDTLVIGKTKYDAYPRQETRCRWARSMGMTGEEGANCLDWKKPDLPVPDELTEEEAERALAAKDRIQTRAYGRPCQTDTIVERCLQVCPAGKTAVGRELPGFTSRKNAQKGNEIQGNKP